MTVKRLYAQGTTVPAAKSRAEIETLVLRHGAAAPPASKSAAASDALYRTAHSAAPTESIAKYTT